MSKISRTSLSRENLFLNEKWFFVSFSQVSLSESISTTLVMIMCSHISTILSDLVTLFPFMHPQDSFQSLWYLSTRSVMVITQDSCHQEWEWRGFVVMNSFVFLCVLLASDGHWLCSLCVLGNRISWYWLCWIASLIVSRTQFHCQALHVIVHYFLVCNYFWMFCEGLYLHTLLVVAFVSEEKMIKWFYCIGWGVPFVLTVIYASFRGTSPTDTVM